MSKSYAIDSLDHPAQALSESQAQVWLPVHFLFAPLTYLLVDEGSRSPSKFVRSHIFTIDPPQSSSIFALQLPRASRSATAPIRLTAFETSGLPFNQVRHPSTSSRENIAAPIAQPAVSSLVLRGLSKSAHRLRNFGNTVRASGGIVPQPFFWQNFPFCPRLLLELSW